MNSARFRGGRVMSLMILGNRGYCANLILFHGVQHLVGGDRVLLVEMLYEQHFALPLSLSLSVFLCISYCAFRLNMNSNDLTGGIPDTGHPWRDNPLPPRRGAVKGRHQSQTGVPPAIHRHTAAHTRAAVDLATRS